MGSIATRCVGGVGLVLLVAAAQAQESTATATVSAYTPKPAGPVPFALSCSSPGCRADDPDEVFLTAALEQPEGAFYRARAEGYFGLGGTAPHLLTMHGFIRQELGEAAPGTVWTTQLELRQTTVWTWDLPSDAFWQFEYRFDGERFNGLGSAVSGSVVAEALGTTYYNDIPGPLEACMPVPGTDRCRMPFMPAELGAGETQTLALRLTATLSPTGSPSTASLQWADYTHTLELVSATPYGADGKPLSGWTLYADGVAVFSSPVPEPPAALLAMLGLAAAAVRRFTRAGDGPARPQAAPRPGGPPGR